MNKKIKQYSINQNASLKEAIKKISSNIYKTLVILNTKKVVGILSEGDIIRAMYNNVNYISPVNKYMTTHFRFISKKNEVDKVINFYKKYNISIVPVCDKSFNLNDIILIPEIIKKKL